MLIYPCYRVSVQLGISELIQGQSRSDLLNPLINTKPRLRCRGVVVVTMVIQRVDLGVLVFLTESLQEGVGVVASVLGYDTMPCYRRYGGVKFPHQYLA